MIFADTDILSALAKIARLPLLFTLFQTSRLYIAPGVLGELVHSLNMRRQYAEEVFALVSAGQLVVVSLTQEEVSLCDTLPFTLVVGERESIASARERDGVVLSNESRVAHYCQQLGISCLRLPDILRALWVENVVSKQEVRRIIKDLQIQDRMQFKQSTIDIIFADEKSESHA